MSGVLLDGDKTEEVDLEKAATFLLEECRMVLPGIQAIFGFQLMVVFNAGFDQKLGPVEQVLHLVATAAMATAVALVMTPAAYHRQTNIAAVSEHFIRLSSRLLLWGMIPLMAGLVLDFFLLSHVLIGNLPAALLTAAVFTVFTLLWFVLPRVKALRDVLSSE